MRFVPHQDAQHLVECLTAHMQHEFAKLRSGNELSVKVRRRRWWLRGGQASSTAMLRGAAVVKVETLAIGLQCGRGVAALVPYPGLRGIAAAGVSCRRGQCMAWR